jgi:predicted flap endonuclease-1-like 5' DNA nuclease
MTFLFLKIAGLMLLAAGFGAWLARWFFRHRYEDVTVQYQGWQNDWAQWRKGLDSKLSLRQMIDLSPVTERLNELESLVRGFGMPKPPPVDLEPVLEAVRTIRLPDAPTYDFTPLYSRMYQIEQHVAGIRIPDLAPLHHRLDALEASVQRSVAAIEIPKPIPTDLRPVLDSLVAVDQHIGSIRIPDLAPVMTGLNAVVETSRRDLAPLYARLVQVETAIGELPRPVPVDLVPVMDRIAAVDARVGAIRIPEPPAPPNLQPVEARIDALERAVLGIRMPTLDLTPVHARLAELENRLEHAVRDSVASIPVPPAPREADLGPVMARLDAVEAPLMQRLAAVESRIGAIRIDPPPPVDLAPVQARLDALLAQAHEGAGLEERLGQLEASLAQRIDQTVGKLPTPAAPDFAPVLERLGSIEAKVHGIRIPAMPPLPPVTNLTPLHDKIDALSRIVGGLKSPPAPAPVVAAAPATAVDLGPLRSALDKRLDALEHVLAALRTSSAPAQAPAPVVDLNPIVDRMRSLEVMLGRIESTTRAESMTLRRSAPVAAATVEPVVRAQAAAPVAAKIAEAAITKASIDHEPAQLGLGFDPGVVRSGSRNLLTHPVFGKPDNLKDIVGVAVGLERLLHDVGVYYFWQIAEWTPQDVAYVDTKLKAFKGRITRDAWISQSVKLAAKAGAAKKPT